MTCIMTGHALCGVLSETFSAIIYTPTANSILQNPLLSLVGRGSGWWVLRPMLCPPAPQLSFQRKVGVLYCRAGQGSEEEMYNNEDAGAAFMQFLTLLGDVVRLKGFENYRAQLDTKSEAWGQGGGLAYLCI